MTVKSSLEREMIPYGRQEIDEDDIQAVVRVLKSPNLTQGPAILEFEKAVAAYVGARYAVSVSNGTAALHVACLAAGLQPGETLVTTPNTFVASANCGLYAGARVRFADIDPATLNIDPAEMEKILGQETNTRVVIPVHFAGAPCDMARIQSIARTRKAVVIEDACHALGGRYPDGGRMGNCRHSEMTVFSFHPVKPLTTGEGGMITTNDETLYRNLLELRSHGITKDPARMDSQLSQTDGVTNPWYYELQTVGFNYRLTDIQAALGSSQLKKLDSFLSKRRTLVARYDERLAGARFIRKTQPEAREQSAHHLYVVRIDFKGAGLSRAQLMKNLQTAGIGTQVHYIPVHWQPVYRKLGFKRGDFPQSEAYYEEALSLPLYSSLSESDQDHVISEVRRYLA